MTETSRRHSAASRTRSATELTAWAGWVAFGGVMLMLMGVFHAIEGLVALFDDGFYLVRPSGLVVDMSYTTWGWIHLLTGLVAVAAGLGLFTGNMAARAVAVAIAAWSALVNVAFVSAYPVWSTIVIVLDLIVIYAIIVHGRELENEPR